MRLQISLPPESWEHLKDIAARELRDPRQQASLFIIEKCKERERQAAEVGNDR